MQRWSRVDRRSRQRTASGRGSVSGFDVVVLYQKGRFVRAVHRLAGNTLRRIVEAVHAPGPIVGRFSDPPSGENDRAEKTDHKAERQTGADPQNRPGKPSCPAQRGEDRVCKVQSPSQQRGFSQHRNGESPEDQLHANAHLSDCLHGFHPREVEIFRIFPRPLATTRTRRGMAFPPGPDPRPRNVRRKVSGCFPGDGWGTRWRRTRGFFPSTSGNRR